MSIEEKLKNVMEQNGVYITDDLDEELDFDSITFISTIVCIESEFGIEVPDELLLFEKFRTFRMYVENITKILNDTNV